MNYLYSAGIVVYRTKNKNIEYLLLQYSAGHWDFAKGKIEQGESKEQAALRELKEETNLTATIQPDFMQSFEYFFTDYDGEKAHKTVYFFVGQANSENVILSDEHTDFAWLPYQKAFEQLTFKNAKELLQEVENYLTKKKES